MAKSKIEWLARPGTIPESWNPVTGCTKVSEGCRNCYAERMARRLAGRHGYPAAPHHFDVTLRPDRLDEPLRWKKPRTVFVCSMGDWMHPFVPIPFRAKMLRVMEATPQHTYLTLTKRVHEMRDYILEHQMDCPSWPAPNVWLGITVENQEAADERIPLLLQTPAAVRFISYEPALGPIDLVDVAYSIKEFHGKQIDGLTLSGLWDWLHWVIVGGESGPGARPMHPDWARSLRDQCQTAGVPFFFKQWGAWAHIPADTRHHIPQKTHWWPDRNLMGCVGKHRAGRLLDGREWNEWPR